MRDVTFGEEACRVAIVASMPCYSPKNVNEQRGNGVFDSSILALQKLNALGYGRRDGLRLDLVYNPNGDFLPGDQAELDADYKHEMKSHFDIEFHQLYCITNMPIARFKSWLKNNGRLDAYMDLLRQSFNPAAVAGLMCRNTLSIGWQGEVFDCDFNQQLGMQWRNGKPLFSRTSIPPPSKAAPSRWPSTASAAPPVPDPPARER